MSVHLNDRQRKRIGFDPDVLLRVVGVTFDGRQKILVKAYNLCTDDYSVPAVLKRDPTNKFDAGAVKVLIGTYYDTNKGKWLLEQAGFLPKNYILPNDRTNIPVWSILDRDPDAIQIAVDGIWQVQGNFGLGIALKYSPETRKNPIH